jgi:NAD-dependent deacetylase
MSAYNSIVILTGAGISAESGISTFRDGDGLWCNHRIEDVATPKGFECNPQLVHDFYNARRAQLADVEPNAAHLALARLANEWPGRVTVITQNVDDLHGRALTKLTTNKPYGLLHMHGELKKARCVMSDEILNCNDAITTETLCPCCGRKGTLRPHIVWFGEMPLFMEVINFLLRNCALFLSIGTSGNVYPAAGFVNDVRVLGKAHTVELNMEPSYGESSFHEKIYGRATEIVPDYVQEILGGHVIEVYGTQDFEDDDEELYPHPT